MEYLRHNELRKLPIGSVPNCLFYSIKLHSAAQSLDNWAWNSIVPSPPVPPLSLSLSICLSVCLSVCLSLSLLFSLFCFYRLRDKGKEWMANNGKFSLVSCKNGWRRRREKCQGKEETRESSLISMKRSSPLFSPAILLTHSSSPDPPTLPLAISNQLLFDWLLAISFPFLHLLLCCSELPCRFLRCLWMFRNPCHGPHTNFCLIKCNMEKGRNHQQEHCRICRWFSWPDGR